MGLTVVPSINLYWSKDPMFNNKFISSVMTRDRFLLLLKFIHFENNEHANTENRLYKIDRLINLLLERYKNALQPGRILVIDESMIPFRGRLKFKQYIPNKTHKYGVKLYKLCTSNGYTYNLKVYTGKGDTNQTLGHSQTIVLKLLEVVDEKEGRILYADNFYSSVGLARKLYDMKMLYCGTLRINRKGVPKDFAKKVKKGDVFGLENNGIKVIKWVDKRPVLMITTDPTHDNTLISIGRLNRNSEEICKPKCVIDYNKAKKGVDYSDQMSSYHTVIRKSMKWYRKVIFEILLGTSVVNAWILYNMISETKLGITEFRRELAENLIEDKSETATNYGQPPKKRAHTLKKPEGPGRKRRKNCKGCYQELRKTLSSKEADKRVRKVISYCNDCPGMPGYCLNCFNLYHS